MRLIDVIYAHLMEYIDTEKLHGQFRCFRRDMGSFRMQYIDMHCDTLSQAFMKKRESIFRLPDDFMVDLERMQAGGCLAQFFAIFMQPELTGAEPKRGISEDMIPKEDILEDMEYIKALLRIFHRSMEEPPERIAPARSVAELEANEAAGKMSGILSIEDGRAVDGRMEHLEWMHAEGIRMIALTWNHENCFGFPNSVDRDVMSRGLKSFGKEAVLRMNELGMVVDVSHLSDGGFMDVAELSRKPFIASHSNCRALSPHRRNLSDEMIRILAGKGGIMGLNFYGPFLNADGEAKESTISRMLAHLKHVVKVGGIETAAIGTDFDGMSGSFEIGDCSKMQLLFDAMTKAGFTIEEIEKIAYKNVKRVMRDIMG